MELKVGMYVRFNYHRVTVPIQIAKIKEKHYEEIEKYYYYLTDNGLIISEENIIKSSKNIIDLIEVGDYVNGKRVDEIVLIEDVNYIKTKVSNTGNYDYLPEHLIKNLVTKEQFESIKYEVK